MGKVAMKVSLETLVGATAVTSLLPTLTRVLRVSVVMVDMATACADPACLPCDPITYFLAESKP